MVLGMIEARPEPDVYHRLALRTTRKLVFVFDFNVMIMNSMGFDATAPLGGVILFFRI